MVCATFVTPGVTLALAYTGTTDQCVPRLAWSTKKRSGKYVVSIGPVLCALNGLGSCLAARNDRSNSWNFINTNLISIKTWTFCFICSSNFSILGALILCPTIGTRSKSCSPILRLVPFWKVSSTPCCPAHRQNTSIHQNCEAITCFPDNWFVLLF